MASLKSNCRSAELMAERMLIRQVHAVRNSQLLWPFPIYLPYHYLQFMHGPFFVSKLNRCWKLSQCPAAHPVLSHHYMLHGAKGWLCKMTTKRNSHWVLHKAAPGVQQGPVSPSGAWSHFHHSAGNKSVWSRDMGIQTFQRLWRTSVLSRQHDVISPAVKDGQSMQVTIAFLLLQFWTCYSMRLGRMENVHEENSTTPLLYRHRDENL
jgi:hypothetical protein